MLLMCVAFDSYTTGKRWTSDQVEHRPLSPSSEAFIARLTHLLSLLHALALQSLRGDEDLTNIVLAPPRTNGWAHLGKRIERMNSVSDSDGVADRLPPHIDRSEDGTVTGIDIVFVESENGREPQVDDDVRLRGRLKGTYALHAAEGDPRTKRMDVKRLFLLDESEKEWIACNRAMKLSVIGSLNAQETEALRSITCDRAYLVMSWIHSLIMLRMETTDGLQLPPPILSRVHQVLSDGLLGRE